jgi:hypothetical protein
LPLQAGRQPIAFDEAGRKVVMVFVVPAAHFIAIMVMIAVMVPLLVTVSVVIAISVFAVIPVLITLPMFAMVMVVSNGDTGEGEYCCSSAGI